MFVFCSPAIWSRSIVSAISFCTTSSASIWRTLFWAMSTSRRCRCWWWTATTIYQVGIISIVACTALICPTLKENLISNLIWPCLIWIIYPHCFKPTSVFTIWICTSYHCTLSTLLSWNHTMSKTINIFTISIDSWSLPITFIWRSWIKRANFAFAICTLISCSNAWIWLIKWCFETGFLCMLFIFCFYCNFEIWGI